MILSHIIYNAQSKVEGYSGERGKKTKRWCRRSRFFGVLSLVGGWLITSGTLVAMDDKDSQSKSSFPTASVGGGSSGSGSGSTSDAFGSSYPTSSEPTPAGGNTGGSFSYDSSAIKDAWDKDKEKRDK